MFVHEMSIKEIMMFEDLNNDYRQSVLIMNDDEKISYFYVSNKVERLYHVNSATYSEK